LPAFVAEGSSSSLTLPLTMLKVLGPAMLLNEVFERLKQPGLLGQILAGVLIGPSVLGWISPNEFLSGLAQLGVMFLLFNVGLHVKSADLIKTGPIAIVVAVLGVVVPFLAGWGTALLWKTHAIDAIFLGASMVATSVGITAQVLSARGWLDETASRIILGAAVIDDILGLLILATVSSLAEGQVHILELTLTALLASAFTVVLAIWGSKAMARFVPKMNKTMLAGEAPFVASVVLLFALSVLAVYAGVAAIVGSFLAGLALSGSVENRVHDLTQGVTELLLPFFLVGIGLHFDLAALRSWSTAGFAFVIVVVAVLSKFMACWLASYRMGRIDSVRVGIGMIPRGEVGMVVAQIGLSLGVVSHTMYDGVVLMTVATTFIAPPLLAWSYKNSDQFVPTAVS
jgi:Kef-type K+ transport system membrane component KefB